MSDVLCRFAPSPNGLLHLGHAYSAYRNRAVADRLGGRMLLRMEDIDTARCTPALAAGIVDDLAWIGLRGDGAVMRQSERFPHYAAALDDLAARRLAYPCICTRGEIAAATAGRTDWPRDPDGTPLYPGTCRDRSRRDIERHLATGRPAGLRLDNARARAAVGEPVAWSDYGEGEMATPVLADPAAWGDAVLRRKDIPASYHIAVVVDDWAQGITDVVRGRDLFAATSLHRLLQSLLGAPAPRYHHHRLVRDVDGTKLSKSRNATALADLRRAGVAASDVPAMIAARLDPLP